MEEGEKNIRAPCKFCARNKTLSRARNTTSNFKKYLEKVHKNLVLQAKEVEGAKGKGKRPRAADDIGGNDQPLKRQCTLPSILRDISSTKLRKSIFGYIIEDMQPLFTIDSPTFRKLIGSICPYQLPGWKSFTQHLEKLSFNGQEGEDS